MKTNYIKDKTNFIKLVDPRIWQTVHISWAYNWAKFKILEIDWNDIICWTTKKKKIFKVKLNELYFIR